VTKFTIALSNSAGPLDEKTIEVDLTTDDMAVTKAVIAMIEQTPLADGDIVTVYEIIGRRNAR